MKSRIMILYTLIFASTCLFSQQGQNPRIPLIGADAPTFTAASTKGTITFPGDFGMHWKILLSHPKDFTPVCSSELLEIAQMQNEFDDLDVKIVVLSTDTLYQHQSWKNTLDTLHYKGRDPRAIQFPLLDDNSKRISYLYGMLHNEYSTSRDVRGVYIIDPNDKVRAIFFYPMEVGRNLNEIKRTVIALQTSDSEHVLTPANWQPGDDVFLSHPDNKTGKDGKSYFIAPFMIAKKLK